MKRELTVPAPSPSSIRMRRSRKRRRQGEVIVSLPLGPDVTADLVELCWLAAPDRTDKHALSRAIVDLIEQAMTLRVTRSTGSEGVCYTELRATDRTIATETDLIAQQLSSSLGPPSKHAGLQRAERDEALGVAGGETEIVEDEPQGAQPWAERMRPYEIDPIELWVPRLDLFTRAGMWVPEWGPRPGQIGCAAPEQLLEDYGIRPPGLE
jgi:hypothetical protein